MFKRLLDRNLSTREKSNKSLISECQQLSELQVLEFKSIFNCYFLKLREEKVSHKECRVTDETRR